MSRRTGILLAVLLIMSLALGTAVTAAPTALTITGPVTSGGGGVVGTYPRSVDGIIAQPVLARGEANGVRMEAGLGGVIAEQDAGGAPLRFRLHMPRVFR